MSHNAEIERLRRVYTERDASDYADRYSHFNPGNLLIVQEREAWMVRLLRRHGLHPLRERDILEVGCGDGYWLRQFIQWGAAPDRLTGIELDPDRAERARALAPAGVDILEGDAARTSFADSSFDLILQSTVFTSILDGEVRQTLAAEMVRLVRSNGILLWYDFRYDNPRNADVRGVRAREIRRLFPGCEVSARAVTLAPFLARRIAPVSTTACRALGLIPFLRTHLLAVIRPPATAPG